jgi:hypothetical protein
LPEWIAGDGRSSRSCGDRRTRSRQKERDFARAAFSAPSMLDGVDDFAEKMSRAPYDATNCRFEQAFAERVYAYVRRSTRTGSAGMYRSIRRGEDQSAEEQGETCVCGQKFMPDLILVGVCRHCGAKRARDPWWAKMFGADAPH